MTWFDKLARGLGGFTKVILNRDPAEPAVVAQRRAICQGCPFKTGNTITARCKLCSCVIAAKTKLKHEACPRRYW